MVITAKTCEIRAMLAPCVVSPPYAAGKMMVFRPNGIANALSAIRNMSGCVPIPFNIKMTTRGMIIKRRMEINARRIDELGRIVLPTEAMGWNRKSKISITREDKLIILQTYQENCFVCANEENLTVLHGKYICHKCV